MLQNRPESYVDKYARLYRDIISNEHEGDFGYIDLLARQFTFQVTDACNLRCTYCYQINKGTKRMPFEVAKKVIDDLLTDKIEYMNTNNCHAIVLDFIGGEPLLEIELIDQIVEYFQSKAIELMHPWATNYIINLTTNGTLYFDPKVQEVLHKHSGHLSMAISLDGNKELHDKCRIFPDGRGSYDLAYAAAKDWMNKGGYAGSKITICPENLLDFNKAIQHFINMGYRKIFANTVFEEGWVQSDATTFYWELKKLADYLLQTEIYKELRISVFEPEFFVPMNETDNKNWCGGTSMMLSVDPDGYYYPCVRYMESSLGGEQPPLRIGSIDTGVGCTEKDSHTVQCLACITRRSQSTDECFYCPIAKGCAWCSAYNYQVFGTPDKRATFMCEMHKARALANVYYWNKQGIHMDNHCPKEWALEIIPEEEFNMLSELAESTRK